MNAHLFFLFAVGHLSAALPEQDTSASQSSPPPGGCLLPDTPRHGVYTSPVCKAGVTYAGCYNVPGNPVPSGWVIKYRCNRGYDVSSEGSAFSVCDNGVWDGPIDCVRMCPQLTSSTLIIKCKYRDREVDCNKPMRSKTTAEFKCKPNYSLLQPLEYSSMLCDESDGLWNHPLPECVAGCGTSMRNQIYRIHYGTAILPGQFPWLVALYKKDTNNKWEQVCGGTLISSRAVLTAAHCLLLPEGNIRPENVKVGLGKLARDFYVKEDLSIMANVSHIAIPRNYLGTISHYALDVAVLKLSVPVEFNNHILPACIIWDETNVVNTGTTVHVAGWGQSENNTVTDIAYAAELSYLPYSECLLKVNSSYQIYVTHDKICSQSNHGAQVDRGDSGGGLTIVREGRHFLIGIVSTKIIGETAFSIFTDMSNLEVQALLRKQKSWLD